MKDIVMMLYPEQISAAVSQAKALRGGVVKDAPRTERAASSAVTDLPVSNEMLRISPAEKWRRFSTEGSWRHRASLADYVRQANVSAQIPPKAFEVYELAEAQRPNWNISEAEIRGLTRIRDFFEGRMRPLECTAMSFGYRTPDGRVFNAGEDGWFENDGIMPCGPDQKVRIWLRYGSAAVGYAVAAKSWDWSLDIEGHHVITRWKFAE